MDCATISITDLPKVCNLSKGGDVQRNSFVNFVKDTFLKIHTKQETFYIIVYLYIISYIMLGIKNIILTTEVIIHNFRWCSFSLINFVAYAIY